MKRIGFMGLGTMGLPMARNLARVGLDLTVYNRTPAKALALQEVGAGLAESPARLLAGTDTVIMMLSGPSAIEETLGRVLKADPTLLHGKLVVNMGTNPPSYGRELAQRLEAAGAGFVDAPVLGTREPAEKGELLIMASGADEDLERLAPLFEVLGGQVAPCGPAPGASMMKLAVNLVLSTSLEGLLEGTHFCEKAGLDLETFFQLILKGPLGNAIFALKAGKLLARDYEPQASLHTVREMLKHVVDTAYDINAYIPGALNNLNLVTAAVNQGLGQEDACALIKVFDAPPR